MKTRIINKEGRVWTFPTFYAALPYIKWGKIEDFDIIIENGEKIRVYDDRYDYQTELMAQGLIINPDSTPDE